MAEEIVIAEDRVHPLPEGVSDEIAAALLLTYGTTLHALQRPRGLKAGETLLVLGAAGGVGLSAVELGKAMGARVIAAVSSEEKARRSRAAGADDCVIYGPTALRQGRRARADQAISRPPADPTAPT